MSQKSEMKARGGPSKAAGTDRGPGRQHEAPDSCGRCGVQSDQNSGGGGNQEGGKAEERRMELGWEEEEGALKCREGYDLDEKGREMGQK